MGGNDCQAIVLELERGCVLRESVTNNFWPLLNEREKVKDVIATLGGIMLGILVVRPQEIKKRFKLIVIAHTYVH